MNQIINLKENIIASLDNENFQELFINQLGWDVVRDKETTYKITNEISANIIAQKCGVDVWKIEIPNENFDKKTVMKFLKSKSTEYFILYIVNQIQEWEFPSNGRIYRYQYKKNFHNDSFIQRLVGLSFTPEESSEATIIDVLDRLNSNFNTDNVSKRFYSDYMKIHNKISDSLTLVEDDKDKDRIANSLLTRYLFTYFIQKKGFLDNNLDYLNNLYSEYKTSTLHENFYDSVLSPLFYYYLGSDQDYSVETLNKISNIIGEVPEIKGDIYSLTTVESKYISKIKYEDKIFELIYEFLESYRWHLDETPSLENNEINPEILGYILQQYVTGIEEGDEAGAFYTKNDITDYITSKTLSFKLLNIIDPSGSITKKLLIDHPQHYIESSFKISEHESLNNDTELLLGETPALYELRKYDYKFLKQQLDEENITSEIILSSPIKIVKICHDAIIELDSKELNRVWDEISDLKVLDPTCGSGAFLFSAMQLLESIYLQIISQAKILPDAPRFYQDITVHKNLNYYVSKKIALENLFGVDLMQEGIDVANLRLYLALVSRLNTLSEIEPMPILEFNIRRGNLLVGFTNLQELAQKNETGSLALFAGSNKILSQIEEVNSDIEALNKGQLDTDIFSREEEKQKSIRSKLGRLKGLTNTLYAEHVNTNLETPDFVESHVPFTWPAEFPQIFQKKGGFDVIIGNPPYVQKTKIKSYRFQGGETAKCPDIYATCTERAVKLLNDKGTIGFIVPMTLSWSKKYQSLRDYLTSKFKFTMYSTFAKDPAALFNGSKGKIKTRNTVFISNNDGTGLYATNHNVWRNEYRTMLFRNLQHYKSKGDLDGVWPKLGNPLAKKVFYDYSDGFNSHTIGHYMVKDSKNKLFYKKIAGYWFPLLFQNFPVYSKDGSIKYNEDPYVGTLNFETEKIKYAIAALLASKFGYFWQAIIGDDFHTTGDFVKSFPLLRDFEDHIDTLSNYGKELENIINDNPDHRIWITNNTVVSNIMWSDPGLKNYVAQNIDKYIFDYLDIPEHRVSMFQNTYDSFNVKTQDVRGQRGSKPTFNE